MKNKSDILLHAIIIYTDKVKENFEAIKKIGRGVIIGRIIDGEFVDCGFISKRNIKEIKK